MDILTFAQDKDVEIAVRDYFNDFLKSQNRYSGYVDNTISFAEKEKNVNRLVMGAIKEISGCNYDTSLVEAFFLPKGTAVELYATTLHYAPCSVDGAGFQVAIVLPKGTNLPLDEKHEGWEDQLITAKNKWLIGHAEGGLPEGSHIGLIGENISVG